MKGGHVISEYAVELIRNADVCYVSGAFVAGIVMAAAAIETWLRWELAPGDRTTFAQLIDASGLPAPVVQDAHALRRHRNRWVHVDDPADDQQVIEQLDLGHPKLEQRCRAAMRTLRRVVFSRPWV